MSSQLKEGTLVRILRYEKRPEFVDKEAEIGNFKDRTYECWMTDDDLEGTYALCPREDIEVVVPEAKNEESGKVENFRIGDRVRGKDSGKIGTVVSVDPDGDPKVKLDGDDEEALQRFGNEFEIVERAPFAVGDRVKGKDSGKVGTVVSLDEDGDPKVKLDGEDDAQQRFGTEFEVITKEEADGGGGGSRSRSRSGKGKKKDKKGKKKKGKSSSSSSGSSSSSESSPQAKKGKKNERKSAFGRSTLEKMEDEKKAARKFQRKMDGGADAALDLLGLGSRR